MGLNIKNERVHALVREAARRTGLSQTSVVEAALERLLAELRMPEEDRVAAAMRTAGDFARRLSQAERARLSTDSLYDERGLPT